VGFRLERDFNPSPSFLYFSKKEIFMVFKKLKKEFKIEL